MDSRIIEKKLQILQSLAVESSISIGGWRARLADNYADGKYRYLSGWKRT